MLEFRQNPLRDLSRQEAPAPPSGPAPDLRSALGVLRRHKWLILGTMVSVVGLALLIGFQIERRYTATALVAVDSRDAKVLGFEPGVIEGLGGNSLMDTEVEIARSNAVLTRAAEELDLASWPEFAPEKPFLDMALGMVGLGATPEPAETLPRTFRQLSESEQTGLVKELAEHLDITRRGLTSVISISATSTSPAGAARIANTLADVYLQEQIEAKLSSTERATAFLRGRVASLAADIDTIEAELDILLTRKLAEVGSPEVRALLLSMTEATHTRETAANTLAEIRASLAARDYARLPQVIQGQQSTLARQRQQLLDQLAGANQETVAEVRRRLADLDQEIRSVAEERAAAVQREIDAAEGRAAMLRTQFESVLGQQQLPKEFSQELFRLQRDLDARRKLYDSFVGKLGQIEQQSDFNLPDSRIIASASTPDRPSFPPMGLIAVGAIVFSLFAGVGLAFLRENLVGGVTSIKQLESLTGVPVVAGVPRYSRSEGDVEMALVEKPFSGFSEAIRRAALGIEAFAPKKGFCFFVTSPLPGDGKTTIALSLARQMAITGSKTLLIDADLRNPTIARALKEAPKRGLVDFLTAPPGAERDLPVLREGESRLDFVISRDPSPVATDALLLTERFADLMRFARENYDVVVIDTPPVGLVVDAKIVAKHCDLALFVVRYAATSQQHITASLRDLTLKLDLPVCAVLNLMERVSGYEYAYQRERYYR